MPLIGLRHKTQWEESNFRVGHFWVPNTFLKPYLNSEPISCSKIKNVLPRENTIYMVPRPLQKLGGNSLLCSQGCVRRPYVCVCILKPKNSNSTFSAFFLYFICLICLYSSLSSHVYVSISLFMCCLFFTY